MAVVFGSVAESPHHYRIMGLFDNKYIPRGGFALFIRRGLLYTYKTIDGCDGKGRDGP